MTIGFNKNHDTVEAGASIVFSRYSIPILFLLSMSRKRDSIRENFSLNGKCAERLGKCISFHLPPFYRSDKTRISQTRTGTPCSPRVRPVARVEYPGHRDGNTELIRLSLFALRSRAVARVSSGVSRRVATIIVAGKRALAAAGNNSGPRAAGLVNAFSRSRVSRRVQIRQPLSHDAPRHMYDRTYETILLNEAPLKLSPIGTETPSLALSLPVIPVTLSSDPSLSPIDIPKLRTAYPAD